MTDWPTLGPRLLAAAKGARDTLEAIPEDLNIPGMISQGRITRALKRLDEAITPIENGETQ